MDLNQNLFWDTDINQIDFQEHARFVIHRVITRGDLKDWVQIREFYGLECIKNHILNMRDLDKRTLSLFSTYFNIKREKFRCYSTLQLKNEPFNY